MNTDWRDNLCRPHLSRHSTWAGFKQAADRDCLIARSIRSVYPSAVSIVRSSHSEHPARSDVITLSRMSCIEGYVVKIHHTAAQDHSGESCDTRPLASFSHISAQIASFVKADKLPLVSATVILRYPTSND